jgi:hypothetical protein
MSKTLRLVIILVGFLALCWSKSFALTDRAERLIKAHGPIPKEIVKPECLKEPLPSWFYILTKKINSYLRIRSGYPRVDKEKVCFVDQKVISGAVEMYNMDHSIPMTDFKDEFISTKKGLLVAEGYLKNPVTKAHSKCRYLSYGDLTKDGVLYCSYHGYHAAEPRLGVEIKDNRKRFQTMMGVFTIFAFILFIAAIVITFRTFQVKSEDE